MIASGATIDLYCDNPAKTCYRSDTRNPAQYYHPERVSACRQMARRAGWIVDEDYTLCPECAREYRRKTKKEKRDER